MASQHPYLTASIGPCLLRLATPNIFAMSFMLFSAVIEAWFVSYIGTVALAGLALCLYFASQGAGRVLWPVFGVVFRFVIILCGGLLLVRYNFMELDYFYYLIAAGFIAQAITSASSVYFGAWTKG
ncbi:MAG: hypothetical protein VW162_08440 [Alphaproteobacteria bacterium]